MGSGAWEKRKLCLGGEGGRLGVGEGAAGGGEVREGIGGGSFGKLFDEMKE